MFPGLAENKLRFIPTFKMLRLYSLIEGGESCTLQVQTTLEATVLRCIKARWNVLVRMLFN
jgi:hypothetical protein